MKAVKIYLFFGILTLIFGSVFVKAQETQPTPITKETPTTTSVNNQNTTVSVVPIKSDKNEKYRIGLQDTLEIQVFRNSRLELEQKVNVSNDGTISLPRINGKITAVCKTEQELAESLIGYFKTYLKNPYVNVRATDQKSQPVAVVGAVEKPNVFFLNRKVRLLEVLALAGGPDVANAGSKIQIARMGNLTSCRDSKETETNDEEVEFVGYNLNEVLKGRENPWMQPGDIVSVLVAEEAFVVGNVVKPSKIVLRDSRTLTQAIADAGGLNATAKTDKVIIQRSEPNSNTKSELVFNLKEIRTGKVPDPELQANDVVVVGNDNLKTARNSLISIFKSTVPFIFF